MGYFYLVFGAGRQGQAVIHDLFKNCDAANVTVVEPDANTRDQVYDKFGDQYFNIFNIYSDIDDLGIGASDYDIVLNCAPHHCAPAIAEFAHKHGLHYLDLGGNPEMVNILNTMSRTWATAVVPDCGLAPGLSNILAVDLARKGFYDIQVRCGGLVFYPQNDLEYKLTFSAKGLVSEYSGYTWYIYGGDLKCVNALTLDSRFTDAMGFEYRCRNTSNICRQTVANLYSLGVQNYSYQTIRYPGHWEKVLGWKPLGYLVGDRQRDKELIKRLSDPELAFDREKDHDFVILSVCGEKLDGLREKQEYYIALTNENGYTAMELATSWGITTVAHYILLSGIELHGMVLPERFVDTEWVIQELRDRMRNDDL